MCSWPEIFFFVTVPVKRSASIKHNYRIKETHTAMETDYNP